MLHQDYLMRLIMQFVEGVRRVLEHPDIDPRDAASSLEDVIARAADMDADVLLNLQPESFASIVQISGIDARVIVYIVNALYLEAYHIDRYGDGALAEVRRAQGEALARVYGVAVPDASRIGDPRYADEVFALAGCQCEGLDS